MRKAQFFLFVFFSCLFIFSQANAALVLKGKFSGIVTDAETGLPLPNVSVYLPDLKTGSSTNEKGEFMIVNVNEGSHLVEISHIGYKSIAENIAIGEDTKRDFILHRSILENDAVIVTGVSKASQLKKMPFQVSVVRKTDLLQSASTNIIESLTKQAGVSAVSTGPAISKPVIRGLGYNRVLTVNDGVRQEGQQWGDEHGIEIDESSVNKVEILKGPASLVYGSDAMAGVINIISNLPASLNTINANAGSEYQSNNRTRSIYGNLDGNTRGLSWNVYGSAKAAADYKNKNDGYVFNSKFNQHNAGGYLGYNGSWGYSHLLLSNFDLLSGMVEGERDSLGYFIEETGGGNTVRANDDDFRSTDPEVPYQHIRHFKIASDNNFQLGKKRLSLNVGWQRNSREEFGNAVDPSERALYMQLSTLTYAMQFNLKELKGWKTSIGINGMEQQNRNMGTESLIPDYSLFDIGTYLFVQKDIKKFSLSGGFRFDSRNVKADDLIEAGSVKTPAFSQSYSNFSGSLGATFQAGKKINLKLNLARAFRAPSLPELASNGAHEGTTRYEIGDRQLKSETSLQADAAVEYASEHFNLNLSGYVNRFDNFIFYRKLLSVSGSDSLISMDGNELEAFKFSQEKATLAGVELSLDIHPHPLDWLHFENSFSLVSGQLRKAIEGYRSLPFIPAPRIFSQVRADFKKAGKNLKNLYLKVEVENTLAQDHPFAAYRTETATPGYTLLNAGAGTQVFSRKGKQLFGLYFSASNLCDVAYQNHLSRLKYAAENLATGRKGVYNMGRNFSIKLNVPLNFNIRRA